jgi:plastocyanin
VLLAALSTAHEVGLGVTAAVFIAFALASSFLFPRFRPEYPGRGLLAFIVVAFVFFFGMLTAVEKFGVEEHEGERVAETVPQETTAAAPTTTTTPSTTTSEPPSTAGTTTTAPKPQAATVTVAESEFKIVPSTAELKAGQVTFDAKNDGKIPHDLAIKGLSDKTKLISPGGSAKLGVTLKAGKYELYCSVPGHEAAGMKVNITVS